MVDMMREMINQMMGGQRAQEEGRDLPPYHHQSVCRAYLLGCCPAEILQDTRLESLVSCRKAHEPAHKADFERAQEKKDHYYDVEAYNILHFAIRTVDAEIQKTKNKIDREAVEQGESAEIIRRKRIGDLEEKIKKMVTDVEELGSQGKVEESMRAAKQVEELEQKKKEMENDPRSGGFNISSQRLRVCDDCGAQLNVLDHETRLADHFGGKMHLGMVDIRERYQEMSETIAQRRKECHDKGLAEEKFERRDRPGGSDRDRERDRERRDTRDRGDRKRSRSRSRERRRRSRSSSRDRQRRRDDRERDSGSRGGDRDRDYRRRR